MTGTATVIEFGLGTLAYLRGDGHGGLVARDQVGFDSSHIAEHHQPDLMDTAT